MVDKLKLLLFIIILLTSTAHAGNKLVVKPFIAAGIQYESNYFLSETDERDVTIYHVKPGLEFGYTTPKSNLLFNYTLDASWYDEKGDAPAGEIDIDEYDYIGHDMSLTADTQMTDRIKLSLANTYILTRNADSLDPYSNETIKHKYSKNDFNPRLLYQFGDKYSFGLGYTRTNIDYNSDTDEDSKSNRGAFNLMYNLNRLNSLDLQYQYWKTDYDRTTPDYTSHQTTLSLNRELKYYTITIGAGYQKREFENNSLQDLSDLVWTAQIAGNRPQFLFSISQNYNDTAIANNYYRATRLNAEIGHLFLERLNVKLKGYYQFSDYENEINNREDDTYSIACNTDYKPNEYLNFGFETGYEDRNSNITGNDYNNYYFTFTIRFTPKIGAK